MITALVFIGTATVLALTCPSAEQLEVESWAKHFGKIRERRAAETTDSASPIADSFAAIYT